MSYDTASHICPGPSASALSTAVFTDSRFTKVVSPNGGIVMFGNLAFLARTGKRHTIDIIRTTVDDSDGITKPIPLLAVGAAAHVNAESSSFGNSRGFGMLIYLGATANVSNCTLSNNHRSDVGAGGASVNLHASATFTGCTIQNNTAFISGAGVYISVGLHDRSIGIRKRRR